MKDGRFVEVAETEEIFENPRHEYTKALVRYFQYGKMGIHHGNFGQMIGNRDEITILWSEITDQVESSENNDCQRYRHDLQEPRSTGCKKVLSGYQ